MTNLSPTSSAPSAPDAPDLLDAGSTFHLADSPLTRHLAGLRDQSLAVAGLLSDIRNRAGFMSIPRAGRDRSHGDDDFVMKLVDVSTSSTVINSYALPLEDLQKDWSALAHHVNDALAYLRAATNGVHTRVVILNKYATSYWTIALPLHLHIMIVELGIPPATAVNLLRPLFRDFTDYLCMLDAAPNLGVRSLSLGPGSGIQSLLHDWHMSAIDLGERDFGGQKVHIGTTTHDSNRLG